jgi:filamentous hemagglutinin family protein
MTIRRNAGLFMIQSPRCCAIAIGLLVLTPISGMAQPIGPDATVGTVVTSNNSNFVITGGQVAGRNLFHSFDRFSVPTGGSATFDLTEIPIVTTLFGRVTGGNPSTIDGLLQIRNAQAPVNLFLLNPAGVIFGANARLNLPGSLLVGTASHVNFADGIVWGPSADASTLSISTPIGLQFGANPGAIEVQGTGHAFAQVSLNPPVALGPTRGLISSPFQSITLLGGKIDLVGGSLSAPAGTLELAAIGPDSTVGLTPTPLNWAVDYGAVRQFGSVTLGQRSLLNPSGGPIGSGSVVIRGDRIAINEGSMILNLNSSNKSGGNVLIQGQKLTLSGTGADGFQSRIELGTLGSGSGSNLTIKGDHLTLQGSAVLRAYTFGLGKSGDILVQMRDQVTVQGIESIDPNLETAITLISFLGPAGTLQIDAQTLSVLNGATVALASFGTGTGGATIINAEDVLVSGFSRGSQIGSVIASTTFGSGVAGSLTLNTDRLRVEGGALIGGTIFGSGTGSNVVINAAESIVVQGMAPTEFGPIRSNITASADELSPPVGQRLGVPLIPTGNAGSVIIHSPIVQVFDGGTIRARNLGTGRGGEVRIHADRMLLDRQSQITSSTASGQGGEIAIASQQLLLRNGSTISATAGNSGNGGNIRLNTQYLVAPAPENSDIIATALRGNGGQIQIVADQILGIRPRSTLTAQSDINASSVFGSNGNVTVSGPTFNSIVPTLGLPTQLSNADRPLVVNCQLDPNQAFNISGRGGLPDNPTAPLRDRRVWTDQRQGPIQEATHLTYRADGQIVLLDSVPFIHPSCAAIAKPIALAPKPKTPLLLE